MHSPTATPSVLAANSEMPLVKNPGPLVPQLINQIARAVTVVRPSRKIVEVGAMHPPNQNPHKKHTQVHFDEPHASDAPHASVNIFTPRAPP
jgi:hypothetical protein